MAVVTVNYQTRELIAQLLYSLFRIVGRDQLGPVVVVDNASTDGSLELLRALAAAGLIHLIANRRQRYHGPALNQGLSWLARRQVVVEPAERVDYVWVLDSDCIALRREVIGDAVKHMHSSAAAIAGELWELSPAERGLVALSTLMLDPAKAWRAGVAPFDAGGSPSHALQRSVVAVAPFPFLHGSYVLHLGRGTLGRLVPEGDRANRFYGWAHEHASHDYADHPLGRHLHGVVRQHFDADTGDGSDEAIVRALGGTTLHEIADARPLPPREELRRLWEQGVDLERHLLGPAP